MALRPVFNVLRDEEGMAVDRALVAALDDADAATAREIALTLIARGTRASLFGLVEAYHQLDEDVRREVLTRTKQLYPALREASVSRREQVRRNLLAVLRDGRLYRGAYLLESSLHDRASRVREAAAETLYALAEGLLERDAAASENVRFTPLSAADAAEGMSAALERAEDRRQIVGALDAGLISFNIHLHPSVIEAAMWFVDDLGPRLWSVVAHPGSRGMRVAANVLAGPPTPRLVPFMIMALQYGDFRGQVARVLEECTDAAFLIQWCRQAWRFKQPRIARAMTAVRDIACFQHGRAALLQLDAEMQARVPWWLEASGVQEAARTDALRELYRRADARLKRTVAWTFAVRPHDRSTTPLRLIAGGQDTDLHALAQLELARRRPIEYPIEDLFHAHAGRGATASPPKPEPPPRTFEEYWARFDRMTPDQRVAVGRRLVNADATLPGLLGRHLQDADPGQRVRALRIIVVLGLAGSFSEQLYKLSHDPDAEVRSAAISAIGPLPDAAADRIVRTALSDRDARVQANAVEAIDLRGDRDKAREVMSKLHSPDNRVRANAVKALLKMGVREAAETLLMMLADEDRAQRVSALWLIDHMGLFPLAMRVIEIADHDPDEQVRGRAQILAERIFKDASQAVVTEARRGVVA